MILHRSWALEDESKRFQIPASHIQLGKGVRPDHAWSSCRALGFISTIKCSSQTFT